MFSEHNEIKPEISNKKKQLANFKYSGIRQNNQ